MFIFALWIPFRMGRAGIKFFWSILAGWLVSTVLITMLAMLPLIFRGSYGVDSDLANAMPDGQHVLFFLVFGWAFPLAATAIGGKCKK